MREFPNATPRPWMAVLRSALVQVGADSFDDVLDGSRIFSEFVEGTIAELPQSDACEDNAAFIVHAVNTMEERERLLEEAAGIITDLLCSSEDSHHRATANEFLKKVEDRHA